MTPTPTPLTHEELRGTAIKSRFDGLVLSRSAFNVLAATLGIPADVTWEQTDKGLWEKVASWAINFIEHAAAMSQDVSLDDFANKIAGFMGSQYATQSTEERVAWQAIARLWGNAIKALDGDLLEIEREAIGWALRKVEQSKPVPPPEVKPHVNGIAEHLEAMADSIYAKNDKANIDYHIYPLPDHPANQAANGKVIKRPTPKGFDQVIDLQIADYEAKIVGLKSLKKSLEPVACAALYDLLQNLTQGE